MSKKVLIVEDEPLIAFSIEAAVEDAGHEVLGIANSVSEALDMLKSELPNFVTLDYDLGNETTEELANILASKDIPFALVSGNLNVARQAVKVRPNAVLSKPFSDDQIVRALQAA